MQKNIPEIEARDILFSYNGYNNHILDWKNKLGRIKNYNLTRTQADYILKYHQVTPKVAKKYIQISPNFAEKMREDLLLIKAPEKIWCEKLLCESDKAYH